MQVLHSAQQAATWLAGQVRGGLCIDSRRVSAGDGFIAWPGHATDARTHVRAALTAGAAACLVEAEGVEAFNLPQDDPRVVALPQLKALRGEVAAAYFRHPGAELAMVAVTGTNGKSSTAWWTAQALSLLGQRCGVVGTLGIGEPPLANDVVHGDELGSIRATGLTTPDPVQLQASLRAMVDQGFAACAIEASSVGLAEHRLAGTPVAIAQFTNFTRDHLDYHGDMATYWACKRALFSWPGLRSAVINIDDAQGAALATELQDRGLDVWTVSLQQAARLRAQRLRYVDGGLAFDLHEGDAVQPVCSTLIGDYNASNLMVVLGALRALGAPLDHAAATAAGLTPVPGRMQRVLVNPSRLPEVVVDYAHTPDALEKTLDALRPLAAARGGQLWCVFGCGGDRDATKRPLMGEIAQRLADVTVVTSDNPRSESPQAIVDQIVAGMTTGAARAQVVLGRREAIERSVLQAAVNDVVLLAGKGHETTQEIAGVKHPFSDVQVARSVLRQRGATC